MSVATTLKLPEELKARITQLAKQSKRSAHSIMIEALEREERMRSFVHEAPAADAEIDAGADVYRAEDVHVARGVASCILYSSSLVRNAR